MRRAGVAVFVWLAATPAAAQQRPDSLPRAVPMAIARDTSADGKAKQDSVPRDTVKSPIAVALRPLGPEIRGRRTIWDRDAIFASGALTLPQLLAQVEGVTTFHSGFIASPTATSWFGELGRVRVFLDGVELDALDPREGGVPDLSVVQLWSLEEVALERTAAELRVHLRSWRVRLTTAQTRTDIVTGSENTNLYRGFFGKRTDRGGVFQIAAQQYATTSVRTAGDGDALSAFARAGVARGRLTVDLVASRMGRQRNPSIRNLIGGTPVDDAIGGFEGNDAVGYLRAAWGDADSTGFWMQAIAAAQRHEETGDSAAGADTARSLTQYVATAGVTRWGARLSATARLRVQDGSSRIAPLVHAGWEGDWLAVAANADLAGPDSTRRLDAAVTLRPRDWLHVAAHHGIQTPTNLGLQGPERSASRVELGLRLFGRWVSGGVVHRTALDAVGMPVFDTLYQPVARGEGNGVFGAISGRIRGPFSFSWRGVQWAEDVAYRPKVESHAEVSFASGFEKQIARKTFHLSATLMHDYRGALLAPDGSGGLARAEGAGWFGTAVEMRIGTAYLFWYNQNSSGKVFEMVPGFVMPRLVQLYGVRWEFWN